MQLLYAAAIFLSAAMVSSYPTTKRTRDEIYFKGELGEFFEGDMLLTARQLNAVFEATDTENRNGVRDAARRWPNRTIVYDIIEHDFGPKQIKMILDAIMDIANKSCLKFHRRENKDDYAVIIQGSQNGCFSSVGYYNPKEEDEESNQVINLEKRCFKHGVIVHEILHTIGFFHMQSTYDRDDYVTIVWDNIRPGNENNFKKYNSDSVSDFGVPYDYGSVLHYPSKAFSKNGNKTIIPLQENVKIGQRIGMSDSDILKLNRMYCNSGSDK